jgi:hypothetical protein
MLLPLPLLQGRLAAAEARAAELEGQLGLLTGAQQQLGARLAALEGDAAAAAAAVKEVGGLFVGAAAFAAFFLFCGAQHWRGRGISSSSSQGGGRLLNLEALLLLLGMFLVLGWCTAGGSGC